MVQQPSIQNQGQQRHQTLHFTHARRLKNHRSTLRPLQLYDLCLQITNRKNLGKTTWKLNHRRNQFQRSSEQPKVNHPLLDSQKIRKIPRNLHDHSQHRWLLQRRLQKRLAKKVLPPTFQPRLFGRDTIILNSVNYSRRPMVRDFGRRF